MLTSKVIIKKPKVEIKDLRDEAEGKSKIVGLAYDKGYRIEIEPNQTEREFFLTTFHELFHLVLPDLSERQIIKLEKLIGSALWKIVLKQRRQLLSKMKSNNRK